MIMGKVVSGGAPVEGAYVRLTGPSGDFVSERRTREDGSFRFNVPPGEWQIVAFAPESKRVELSARGDEEDLLLDLGG